MPKRKGVDGGDVTAPTAPKPRARKKKEPTAAAGADSSSGSDPSKLDISGGMGLPSNAAAVGAMMYDGGTMPPHHMTAMRNVGQPPHHNEAGSPMAGGMHPHPLQQQQQPYPPPPQFPGHVPPPPTGDFFYLPPGGQGPMPPGGGPPPPPPPFMYNQPPHLQQPLQGPPPPHLQQHPQQQFADPEQHQMPGGPPPPPFMYNQPPHSQQPPPHPQPQHPGGPPMQQQQQQPHMAPYQPILLRHIPVTPFGPNFPQPPFIEFRIQEMNRRLFSFNTMQDTAQWWEAFAHEFFDDNAQMTLSMFDTTAPSPEMAQRKYTIGRLLIPRFYRTIFSSGVTELFYLIRSPAQERMHNQQFGVCAIDCDNVLMVTRYDKPVPTEVHTECRLWVEFAPFDEAVGYRIRDWCMELRGTQEFYNLPKDAPPPDMETQEAIKKGVTRSGLPQALISFLKLCIILEPMQILMERSKEHQASPAMALKNMCFEMHQKLQQQQPGGGGGMMGVQQLPSSSTPPENSTTAPGKKPPRKRQKKNAGDPNAPVNSSPPKKRGGAAGSRGSMQSMQSVAETPSPMLQQQQQQGGGGFQPNPGAGGGPNSMPFNPMMFPQQTDVLIVGEPTMMGCDFGESDERSIARIENAHYDASGGGGGGNGNGNGNGTNGHHHTSPLQQVTHSTSLGSSSASTALTHTNAPQSESSQVFLSGEYEQGSAPAPAPAPAPAISLSNNS